MQRFDKKVMSNFSTHKKDMDSFYQMTKKKAKVFLISIIFLILNTSLEVFVHHTAIHNDGGFKSLAEGEEVEYDLIKGPKGMQASNVTGPDGTSVQGDPRNQRYQRQSLEIDNNIMPINGGGYPVDSYSAPVVDPYSAPVVYPPMSMYPMYGGYMYPSYFVPNESMYTEQNKE
ncbi:unnamed protein product [Rhizopus stolonifer]